MAERYSLLAAMDRLWFHQIILLTEPPLVLSCKGNMSSPTILRSCNSSSDNSDHSEEDKDSSEPSTSSSPQHNCNDEVEETPTQEVEEKRLEVLKERRIPPRLRLNLNSYKSRSQSSSPSVHRMRKSLDFDHVLKLQRTLSCRSPQELELEELQGFMDLGFQFEKDQLTPRTMRVLPALQRLEEHESSATTSLEGKEGNVEDKRPYLSESWLVKRPHSPLLRRRMARVITSEDMKRCLKLWARTVASSIQTDR